MGVMMSESIPLEQGLRPISCANKGVTRVSESIPLEQGLRPEVTFYTSVLVLVREHSTKTRK